MNKLIIAIYSSGLVGSLAGLNLIKSNNFKLIDNYRHIKLPPVASIHDYVPYHPIRLYQKDNTFLLLSEISFPINITEDFNNYILSTIKKYNIEIVIVLSSIASNSMYYLSNFKDLDIEKIREGVLAGPIAHLLPILQENNVKYLALFSPVSTDPTKADISSTKKLLLKFKEIYKEMFHEDINIDSVTLSKEQKKRRKQREKPSTPEQLYR